jgi:diguanylate cyclase (GGDEF)-like protein
MITLSEAFDEYPKPLFIIKPIAKFGTCVDFEYVYANNAFCLFLGRGKEEIVGHHYLGLFKVEGERQWLDAFWKSATDKKHLFMDSISLPVEKKLTTEIFHIEPDMCGCVIHDFTNTDDENNNVGELSRKAHNDFLTGFYNRFYLKEQENDINQKEKIGISFIDINNLKKVNDTKGHKEGDKLILEVTEMIKKLYTSSQMYRYGGDEFVIITFGMDREEFCTMSEKNREAFEEKGIACVGYCYYEKVKNLASCIEECDLRMYARKRRLKCRA